MSYKLSILNELLNQLVIIRYMYDNLQWMENDYYFPHVPPYPNETSDVSCVNTINNYVKYMENEYSVRLLDATLKQPYLYKMKLLLKNTSLSALIDSVLIEIRITSKEELFSLHFAELVNAGQTDNLTSLLLNADATHHHYITPELTFLAENGIKDVVIFARSFEGEALATIKANHKRCIMNLVAVQVPNMLSEEGYAQLFETMKTKLDGRVFNTLNEDTLELTMFGKVKSITCENKNITIGV